ncbi:MAG: coenzyme F420-0:L-glutamate ligase [Xanthobacteraceae bacterium]
MAELQQLKLIGIPGIPLIRPGDDIVALLLVALANASLSLHDGDVLVIAQKIVSKSQGRYVCLDQLQPSADAVDMARRTGKPPALVQAVLSQSTRVVRAAANVLIVEQVDGFIVANAGIDRSNAEPGQEGERVLLLPHAPDETAAELRADFAQRCGKEFAIIISDSFGRPWRRGTVGVALGAAGVCSLLDLRGEMDLYGRPLQTSEVALADQIAAAASLVMGESKEGIPAVLVRGLQASGPDLPARTLLRDAQNDLFR